LNLLPFNLRDKIIDMSEAVQSILDMIRQLPPSERAELVAEVDHLRLNGTSTSLRDIQPVSAGQVLRPLSQEDDLLGEMGG
jgi:hypothetical protein